MKGAFQKSDDWWYRFADDRVEITGDDYVQRNRIPEYNTDDFKKCLSIWLRYADGHLPYSGGMLEQPVNVYIIISIYQSIHSQHLAEQQKDGNRRRI